MRFQHEYRYGDVTVAEYGDVVRTRTLVLLVERAVATPAAEGVGLGVPLTVNRDV